MPAIPLPDLRSPIPVSAALAARQRARRHHRLPGPGDLTLDGGAPRVHELHATEFIATRDTDRAAGKELALAVVDHEDVLLGAIGMSNFDWTDLKGEIGYWMAREARGRGLRTRALRLLSRWALEVLGLERLELMANPANEASQRLAESAGFTREEHCAATAPATVSART